jgi:GT2 family glycosyltransferase
MSTGAESLSVAVIIPAYTMRRWELIEKAVQSARDQTLRPEHIVLCIDNNDELLERARERWPATMPEPRVTVMANAYHDHLEGMGAHQKAHGTLRRFGAGSARNSAAATVASDVLAFLDDDARAEPSWLQELIAVYARPGVVAVGGAPLPDFATRRPTWFPRNFDWVFGCAYEGLPVTVAPLGHLIGANMSVRREALMSVGGFQSVDFDDLDLCMRLAERFGRDSVYYTPQAVVHHHVTAERVTWRYFYRRCYFVNREKVEAFRGMGTAANLRSEREFVWRALRIQVRAELARARHGEKGAVGALAAMLLGIALAGLGNLRGRLDPVVGGGLRRILMRHRAVQRISAASLGDRVGRHGGQLGRRSAR